MIKNKAEKNLRKEWRLVGLVAIILLGSAAVVVHLSGEFSAVMYSCVVGLIIGYQLFHLYRNLGANHVLEETGRVYPDLGAANWITMLRAFLLALLAGFILLPRPGGNLAWAPGVIYTLAAVLDFVDGSVARLTRRSTRLGEILDMHWDGFGVLAASFLLVLSAQVPPWYLLVGFARYLFVFGLWLRRRLGLPVYDLPPNVFRRALAGVQMGFIAVVLLPIFTPPATWVGALLFALPLLIGFLRDWFFVCGLLDRSLAPGRWQRMFRDWGPNILRGLLVLLLALTLLDQWRQGIPLPWVVMVCAPALVALLLGTAGRFFSLGVLLVSGYSLQIYPLEWRFWILMLLGAAVMTFGTGRYSLWKPEEWLIYHRIGDPSSTR